MHPEIPLGQTTEAKDYNIILETEGDQENATNEEWNVCPGWDYKTFQKKKKKKRKKRGGGVNSTKALRG